MALRVVRAPQVVSAYEGTLTEVPASEAYEHSELLLYKASLLDQAGRLDEALTLLDTSKVRARSLASAAALALGGRALPPPPLPPWRAAAEVALGRGSCASRVLVQPARWAGARCSSGAGMQRKRGGASGCGVAVAAHARAHG